MLSSFLTEWTPLVSDPKLQVSSIDLVTKLVPAALYLLRPAAVRQDSADSLGDTERKVMGLMHSSHNGQADSTLLGAISPLRLDDSQPLFLSVPCSTTAASCSTATATGGGKVEGSLLESCQGKSPGAGPGPLVLVARCLLALLLRSCTSPASSCTHISEHAEYCCLALDLTSGSSQQEAARGGRAAGEADQNLIRSWRQLAPRLLHLCCLLVCCPGGDDLMDASAVRILCIMTDATQWKCGSVGHVDPGVESGEKVWEGAVASSGKT
jgi:hypothetical protein